ncbi:MAG: putative cullin [Streblomastix strix]|uniref:Putative cullin n=1 Tax=Streblomastix strix TaxID=222440 RepID=A0A5J4WY07_9EUKA|nr:MAG: putative cullin [Streblomastix strix]
MDPAFDDLDTIKDVNDAWTRYLKPIIDDIKAQLQQNPSIATASQKNILIFTLVIQHLCQKLDLTNEVVELALRIIMDYCNMEINEPLKQMKDDQFLQGVTQCWETFKISVKIVCSLFQYLDDNYFNSAQPTKNDKAIQLLSLQQRAYNIFKEQVFASKIDVIKSLILDSIDKERSGETINITLMKNAIDMFVDLNPSLEQFYKYLEIEFLQRARAFYQQFTQSSLEQDSIPDFMIKCETAYSVESKRIDNYMNKMTEPKIREVLDEELLKKNINLLINSQESGFRVLLEHDRFEDLGRMYRLITHLDNEIGIDPMAKEFYKYLSVCAKNLMESNLNELKNIENNREEVRLNVVKERQTSTPPKQEENIISDPEMNKQNNTTFQIEQKNNKDFESKVEQIQTEDCLQGQFFVGQILNLFKRFNRMYEVPFQKNSKLGFAVKDIFLYFLNTVFKEFSQDAKTIITKCIDELLKNSTSAKQDNQINTQMDEIVEILKFFDDKSEFLDEIKDNFLEKIFEEGSEPLAINEVEKAFVLKMSSALSCTETSKLDYMLQDNIRRNKIHQQFIDYQERTGQIPEFDLEAHVVPRSFFPGIKISNINLPENLQQALQSFQQFYRRIKPYRQIEFVPQFGTVEVQVQVWQQTYTITMKPIQAIILLQFADGAVKSLRELEQTLQIGIEEVKRNILPMMTQTPPILTSATEGADREGNQRQDDIYLKLNKKFQSRSQNFRLKQTVVFERLMDPPLPPNEKRLLNYIAQSKMKDEDKNVNDVIE